MGLSFKIISMSSSISVPNFMLLPQNPQFCHYFTPFCWTKRTFINDVFNEFLSLALLFSADPVGKLLMLSIFLLGCMVRALGFSVEGIRSDDTLY